MSLGKTETLYPGVATSCNAFSTEFYKALSRNSNGNVISSPFSLHVVLSLLFCGAEGNTLEEMRAVLRQLDDKILRHEYSSLLPKINNVKDVELHVANAMYVQDGFDVSKDFSDVGADVFKSELSVVSSRDKVATANKINRWVETATRNKIFDIVSPDDIEEELKALLVNAVYFKGHWLHAFDEGLTENRPFYLSDSEEKLVPTMSKKSKYIHGEVSRLNSTFVEIPYTNEDVAMIIILPNEIQGLSYLESNFEWESLTKAPRFESEIELYLPKFKYDDTIDLENILRQIGLNTMFQDNANFSRIADFPLKVNRILQKVVIEVDEIGSEAAAATVAQIRSKRMIREPKKFLINHPFMFAIRYKPGNVPLFLGSTRDIKVLRERDEL